MRIELDTNLVTVSELETVITFLQLERERRMEDNKKWKEMNRKIEEGHQYP